MGVNFSAQVIVGFKVRVEDIVVETKEKACWSHGKQKGKHCSECGRELSFEYVPTKLLEQVAAISGVPINEDLWIEMTGYSPCVEVLSNGYKPDNWEWDDGVVIGFSICSTGSHRSGYPSGETTLDKLEEIISKAKALRKELKIESDVKIFSLGDVSC